MCVLYKVYLYTFKYSISFFEILCCLTFMAFGATYIIFESYFMLTNSNFTFSNHNLFSPGNTCNYKGRVIRDYEPYWCELEGNQDFNCCNFAVCPDPSEVRYDPYTQAVEREELVCS